MDIHAMVLEEQGRGEQVWFCPTCERRILLRLDAPDHEMKVVLEPGARARHELEPHWGQGYARAA